MLIGGILYLLYQLCVKVFGLDKDKVIAIGLLTLFIILQCMPGDMARVEGLYWYNSTIYYTFLQGVAYVYIGLLISNLFEQKSGKIIANTIIGVVLAFLLGGANYLTAIICAIMSFIIIVIAILHIIITCKNVSYDKKTENENIFGFILRVHLSRVSKGAVYNIITAIAFFVGFIISVMAPGNSLRESSLGGFNPIKAVIISFYYVFSVAMSEWTNWAVCGLFILSIPIWWKAVKKSEHDFKYPLLAVFILICFNAATITPALYATGNISAGRIQCIFWIQYILLMELAIGYLVGFAKKYIEIKNIDNKLWNKIFTVAIIVYGCIAVLCMVPDRNLFVGTEAINEIVSGTASGYKEENDDRLTVLEDESVSDVVVSSHEYQPELLFHSDITTNADDWTNQAISVYYGKNSVVIGE